MTKPILIQQITPVRALTDVLTVLMLQWSTGNFKKLVIQAIHFKLALLQTMKLCKLFYTKPPCCQTINSSDAYFKQFAIWIILTDSHNVHACECICICIIICKKQTISFNICEYQTRYILIPIHTNMSMIVQYQANIGQTIFWSGSICNIYIYLYRVWQLTSLSIWLIPSSQPVKLTPINHTGVCEAHQSEL